MSNEPVETKAGRKYRTLWNNVVTIGGTLLAVVGLILLLTFGLFSIITPASNPYVDIFGYLIIPGIIAVGVGFAIIGILFRAWRVKRQNPGTKLLFQIPRIDLTQPRQRRTVFVGAGLMFLLLPVIGVSSYHGYQYTDSTQFCATACHSVMEPQGVAYETSAHARVTCAECHIGSGASWFVKAKLSGTRQVLAVMANSYSRPIAPAIHHLRPATDTCEECHWPEKFFGAQLRELTHFGTDEKNTRRDIKMLVKTGGGDEMTARAEGIHMHMTLAGQIEYVAVDETLQHIPWVKWTKPNGTELVYRSDGKPNDAAPPEGTSRRVDCMDCHNRPAHKFRSPAEAMDQFLANGKIDTTLPFIKKQGVEVLSKAYPAAEEAEKQIANSLTEYYRMNHPDVWGEDKASVMQAITRVQEIYRGNIFPSMLVDWRTYPDNIGHLYSPGCFRCHDGDHVNQYGDEINTDCSICHSFLLPTEEDPSLLREGDFIHTWKAPELHQDLKCYQCHTGSTLEPSCEGCHSETYGLHAATLPRFRDFGIEPDSMFEMVDCESCHDLSAPVTMEVVDAACMDCHEGEEGYEGMLGRWTEGLAGVEKRCTKALNSLGAALGSRKKKKNHSEERQWLKDRLEVLDALRRANPLHNPVGAEKIYEQITREALEKADALGSKR